MRSVCILLLCLGAAVDSVAQKFIEVIASDSIQLHPKKIVYEIRVNPWHSHEHDLTGVSLGDDEDADQTFLKGQLEEKQRNLKKFFQTNNIRYYQKPEANLTLAEIKSGSVSFYTDAKSASEAAALLEKLSAFEGIRVRLSDVLYEDTAPLEKKLLQRILDKARKDAQALAELSGLKIGVIGEIRETTPEPVYYAMPPRLDQWDDSGWAWYGESLELRSGYSRSFAVKFLVTE